MKDRVWIELPEKGAKALATTALEAGFTTLVTRGDVRELSTLARVRVLREDETGLHEGDALVAPRARIRDAATQDAAIALAGKHLMVLVDAQDWRVIPYENLIAAYSSRGTRLLARAHDANDALFLLSVLERGVDIVLVAAEHAREVANRLDAAGGKETLVEACVTTVRPVGVGDRACLDTASLLSENEGVLTGSAAGGLFLVASEARESGYVASRPFRVNAGAVHAYVLAPGGKTRYLSEIRTGDEVLACAPDGRVRSVVIGRVKIERRPLLLIEAETSDGRRVSTLLQNAETIRLVTPQGTRSVVQIAPGDTVLVRLDDGGRHFGMRVDETLVER